MLITNLKIQKFEKGLWSYHMLLPDEIADTFINAGTKRLMCQIEDHSAFHAGLMPDGDGRWFIKLNKEKMKKMDLSLGQEVRVRLTKDESKYGMSMPAVFEELLYQDPEGADYFEALSPGKKRTLIYMVSSVKSEEKRIGKAIVILDHLKVNKGKLDFKMLNAAMKGAT